MAARAAALALVLLLAAPLALACDLQAKSCTSTKCSNPIWAWMNIPPTTSGDAFIKALGGTTHPHLGFAVVNNKLTSTTTGYFNYELFSATWPKNYVITTVSKTSPGDCCRACAAQTGCTSFMFYPTTAITITAAYPIDANKQWVTQTGATVATITTATFTSAVSSVPTTYGSGNCLLMTSAFVPYEYASSATSPSTANHVDYAVAGGSCNPAATAVNDPHLVGAQGTKFDFNGGLAESYCLVSDKSFHINTLLDGYRADNTTSSPKSLRTWIKEVGIVWTANGEEHTAHFVARKGKQQERGAGFLASVTVDGTPMPLPQLGDSMTAAGGLKVTFVAMEKKHIFDVDYYTIEVEGIVRLDTRLRVAHPALQSPDDAETHFNIALAYINNTPEIHGVLGQTYRVSEERATRAKKYQTIADALKGVPMAADGPTGAGFLDGSTRDYVSSSILAPDCKFSAYEKLASTSKLNILEV